VKRRQQTKSAGEPNVPDRTVFEDLQMNLQLDLEDLGADQLREHGRTLRVRADALDYDRQRLFKAALQVLVALKRTPGLDDGDAEERFAVWCEGFGLPSAECFDEFAKMVQRWTRRSANRG
jgi:hypothetical protein